LEERDETEGLVGGGEVRVVVISGDEAWEV
jgi:hypothetical protein